MAKTKVWGEIAKEVGARAQRTQRNSARRFRVKKVSPLVLDEIDGDEILEEGDEDFEIESDVKDECEKGDTVLVIVADDGDFVATALLSDDGAPPRPVKTHSHDSLTGVESITFAAVSAGSVPNNSLFRDSGDGKLKYKDGGGTAHALYE
jgi:hypothetical protein